LLIEPIAKRHDRKRFDCGEPEVTRFLREQALQDQGKELSRTMVLVDEEADQSRIVGYYTLLIIQVRQEEVPSDAPPRIRRPIPVMLLGQMGVDKEYQGRGYGERLLMSAQANVHEVSRGAAVRGMVLDAKTESLVGWYEKHGFMRAPGGLRMYKRIERIRALGLIP
jgi:GNAT superfamily N-acetyltransferase